MEIDRNLYRIRSALYDIFILDLRGRRTRVHVSDYICRCLPTPSTARIGFRHSAAVDMLL